MNALGYIVLLKVGLLIGKGGETIKYLQQHSGSKIQITRDSCQTKQPLIKWAIVGQKLSIFTVKGISLKL